MRELGGTPAAPPLPTSHIPHPTLKLRNDPRRLVDVGTQGVVGADSLRRVLDTGLHLARARLHVARRVAVDHRVDDRVRLERVALDLPWAPASGILN